MSRPRAWLCWSSGKDAAWALHVVRQEAEIDVTGLLTTITEPFARVSMHAVREEVLQAQADALELPLHRALIPAPCPNDVYQQAMRRAVEEAKNEGVSLMIFGDLFLEDIRSYRERQLAGTGIAPLFPLWKRPTAKLAEEMVAAGLVAHVTALDPTRVPRELAGARFDRAFLDRLPADVDPCAERGEFHTCATGGPMFRRPIPVRIGEIIERDGIVFSDLLLANDALAQSLTP